MLRNWPLSAVSHSFIELHVFMQVEGASLCGCSSRKLWKITEEAIYPVREEEEATLTASVKWVEEEEGENKGYLYRRNGTVVRERRGGN
jgi:hypothetical protein